ncbi:Sulfite reductase [NADPH] subunit beta [Paramarasmius palmivorus]|uniref:Sulfite reductase [NADPH] subunit beta n=1 Tax=Paramarasmius palmivorus TaxID=297713 RepID=A0AAW0E7B3_9AGAR
MAVVDTVARIAFIASDTLVHSLPPNSSTAAFSFTSGSTKRSPFVVPVPSGGDPVASILRRSANGSLISYLASLNSQSISRLVLACSDLSSIPLVLQVAVAHDLSDALLLRAVAPYFIVSTNPQQAHDNALLASRLARTEKRAVVHVFYGEQKSEGISELDEDGILELLFEENKLNGANGHANGHANGDLHKSQDDADLQAIFQAYERAFLHTLSFTRRPVRPYTTRSSSAEIHTILHEVPATTSRVIVLEQAAHWSMKWTPLYLEVVSALQQREAAERPIVHSGVLGDLSGVSTVEIQKLLQQASNSPSSSLYLGTPFSTIPSNHSEPHVPKHELSYTKILSHLFRDRLEVSNSPTNISSQGDIATTPEFALGRVRGQLEKREELIAAIRELLQLPGLDASLHSLLSKWVLAKDHPVKSGTLGQQVLQYLESSPVKSVVADKILSLRAHFPSTSRWIIGSDAWSYDLGASGLHHAIASGLNVNILLIDTTPYTSRNSGDQNRRKHDVGLYAMNHGDVYVASVAVYSSYAQVLQALLEADAYTGPSVVLAYLPYSTEDVSALDILKETKLAVDAGYWPLYRWDPSKERDGKEPFSLDSDAIKNDLQQFLDRYNHLSQLVRSKPEMASELVSSLGETVKEARKKKAQQSYNELLTALDAPPVTILYASDGGAAEKVAKRVRNRAQVRGLTVTLATMDSVPLDTLAGEEYVVFITSTAGQGEPPHNGRQFFKAINAAVAKGETPFSKLKYTVFGMGDSHYWPRPEDAHYYNKPGKDLDMRLEKLGGERVIDLALGDDQDADGYETGYKAWEPKLWKLLGVDNVEVLEKEPDPITNEHIKAASNYLRGTIVEGLEDNSTGALAASDTQLTKFHGIYQQDDRDIRDERQAQGVEPAYAFMIRVRMPGGVCKPDQWLQMDQIADEHGNGTFKITTRQTFQFHGVIKRHLKPAIQDINRALLDTLAACGDVNRNVICSSIPTMSKLHAQVHQFCVTVSEHLIPRTTAYHEIWLDKKLVAGDALKDVEPLYGEFYLPRKFKIAVAVPPTNDVDVFANDVGFIAIVNEAGELAGFNVTIGGGMGVTFGNKKTYPRTADVIGFCTPEQGKYVAEKIMLVQRDNGNRVDRKNARLKYTIDRMGLDVFKGEVEKLLGYQLEPARSYTFDRNIDDFGWATGEDGKHHFTMFVENGRIQDEPGKDFKTGLREIAKVHKGTFRLTANQHLLISDIADEDLPTIKEILAKYKMDNLNYTGLRLSSSACVAFPTCGLANAESERYLPLLIDKVEKICEENGLRNDSIVMRMTGCPNGCARPYVAEVAFVGKAPGTYLMLLGRWILWTESEQNLQSNMRWKDAKENILEIGRSERVSLLKQRVERRTMTELGVKNNSEDDLNMLCSRYSSMSFLIMNGRRRSLGLLVKVGVENWRIEYPNPKHLRLAVDHVPRVEQCAEHRDMAAGPLQAISTCQGTVSRRGMGSRERTTTTLRKSGDIKFRPNPSASALSFDEEDEEEDGETYPNADTYPRTPSPSPAGTGPLRIRTRINSALFSNELEYLYTGKGFGEAFEFLFDSTTDSSEEARIDKLRRDLVFMWRSRLYSDIRIALSNEHEPSTAVFSTHKFILLSRSTYFANLLLKDPTATTITLPSPPYTPASLHFTLGFLYTGTLSFSHRTYDLTTALNILLISLPLHLNLPTLQSETRARIIMEMCHGLFHAFLPFSEYESITSGREDVRDSILDRGARRALVGLFGEGWCTPEYVELSQRIRESIVKGVKKRTTPQNALPLLMAADAALGILIKKKNMDIAKADLLACLGAINSTLASSIDECLSPPSPDEPPTEWHSLLLESTSAPNFTHTETLQVILSALLKGLSLSNAPFVYQTLVSQVLLLPDPDDPSTPLLPPTNFIRVQVDETKQRVLEWIKENNRWRGVRDAGGFVLKGDTYKPRTLSKVSLNASEEEVLIEGRMDFWAVQEISDFLQIPTDDLLSSPTATPSTLTPTPSTSRASLKVTNGQSQRDESDRMSIRSGISMRSRLDDNVSIRSGVSRSRDHSPSATARTVGKSSPTRALSPTASSKSSMRVSTLSKNLPTQKRVISSASSIRSFRSTTSTATTTTTKDRIGSKRGERPDSKLTQDEDTESKMEIPVPVPRVVEPEHEIELDGTEDATRSSLTSVPSSPKRGLTPKASLTSLASTTSTTSSIAPRQRVSSSGSTKSTTSTIRRSLRPSTSSAAVSSSRPVSTRRPSTSSSISVGKRPVSSASTHTSNTTTTEYKTASSTSNAAKRRERTSSVGSVSAKSLSGVSIRSTTSPNVATKKRPPSTASLKRPPSVASSVRSVSSRKDKETPPPLPKKKSTETLRGAGGVTKPTASSAAKSVSRNASKSSARPGEERPPPSTLVGATLEIGIPCVILLTKRRVKAYAKYIGHVQGEDGNWVGVEVPSSGPGKANTSNTNTKGVKWHDGSLNGIRYFHLSPPSLSAAAWDDTDVSHSTHQHRRFATSPAPLHDWVAMVLEQCREGEL